MWLVRHQLPRGGWKWYVLPSRGADPIASMCLLRMVDSMATERLSHSTLQEPDTCSKIDLEDPTSVSKSRECSNTSSESVVRSRSIKPASVLMGAEGAPAKGIHLRAPALSCAARV